MHLLLKASNPSCITHYKEVYDVLPEFLDCEAMEDLERLSFPSVAKAPGAVRMDYNGHSIT